VLQSLAKEMAEALGRSGAVAPKSTAMLLPLFESDDAHARRVAADRSRRDALVTQRVQSSQRLVFSGAGGAVPTTHAVRPTSRPQEPVAKDGWSDEAVAARGWSRDTWSSTSPAVVGTLSTVLDSRPIRRKPAVPTRLARRSEAEEAYDRVQRWAAATAQADKALADGSGAGAAPARLPIITERTPRLHRHDGFLAGRTTLLWNRYSLPVDVVGHFATTAAAALAMASATVKAELRQVTSHARPAVKGLTASMRSRKLVSLRERIGAAQLPQQGVSGSDKAAPSAGEEPFSLLEGVPFQPQESYRLMVASLAATPDTASLPGWALLQRIVKAATNAPPAPSQADAVPSQLPPSRRVRKRQAPASLRAVDVAATGGGGGE